MTEKIQGKSFCYRVEERVVIPGRKIEVGPSGSSTTQFAEYNELFIIIEGKTEEYLGRSSFKYPVRYTRGTDMPKSEYFSTEEEAKLTAKHLHAITKCNSPKCAWTEKDGTERA